MPYINLIVTLEYSDPITQPKDLQELVDNVARALFHQADTSFLMPEEHDAITHKITVSTVDHAVPGKISKTIKLR